GAGRDAAGEPAAERRAGLADPGERVADAALDVDARPLGAAAGLAPAAAQAYPARQLVGQRLQLPARSRGAAKIAVRLRLGERRAEIVDAVAEGGARVLVGDRRGRLLDQRLAL